MTCWGGLFVIVPISIILEKGNWVVKIILPPLLHVIFLFPFPFVIFSLGGRHRVGVINFPRCELDQ